MKILLIEPPIEDVDNGFETVHKAILFPSLGLYYIREYIRQKTSGIDIEILDFSLSSFEDAVKSVIEKGPDIVGLSCFTDRRSTVLKFVGSIKTKNSKIKIVLGGIHASLFYNQILKNYPVDYVVIGEGEITFCELVETLRAKDEINKVKGIAYNNGNKIIATPLRERIDDLDTIPFPRYNDISNKIIKFTHYDGRYEFNNKKISRLKSISVITSRGCPFNCIYCSTTSFWGRKVRMRSAENVMEELRYLYNTHNVKFINFVDDSFTVDKKRIIELCNKIIEEKLDICWICDTSLNTIDEEMLVIMKKSGCFAINFGVETGSEKIIKNIRKKTSPTQIVDMFNLAEKNGILADMFLMVGNPGEDIHTIKETLKVINKAEPSSGGWGILTIFPGTELYYDCKNKGIIDDNYWLSEKSSPFYLYENSYVTLRRYLTMIKCRFLLKRNDYTTYLRYKLLELRDYIWEKTGFKITRKGIKKISDSKYIKCPVNYKNNKF